MAVTSHGLTEHHEGRIIEFHFGGGSMTGELANVPWSQEEAESGGTWGVVTYRGRWIDLEDCEGWRFLDC